MNNNPQFYIGVACKEHVENGVKLGIAQFCHGKSAPAKRLNKGDYVIYYSSKITFSSQEPYQKFTALGVVKDNELYQADMGDDFKPFRRNIDYYEAQHIDIKPLIENLPFIKNKKSWGYVFRYGFFKIDQQSFALIAKSMLGYSPEKEPITSAIG